MTGVHGDIQNLLRNVNWKAKFVPCSNHSLYLCGVHASDEKASAIKFGVIEIFCIFSPLQIICGKFYFRMWRFGNHPLECTL